MLDYPTEESFYGSWNAELKLCKRDKAVVILKYETNNIITFIPG